jgi:UbiD family decarboxylase
MKAAQERRRNRAVHDAPPGGVLPGTYADLREYLGLLERGGLLKKVAACVDWDLELGAVTRHVCNRGGPALLFETVKDHQQTFCHRVLTNTLGTRERVALALGLPGETPYKEIVRVLKKRWASPLSSIVVGTGPVKEHVLRGAEIDLFQLPVPRWHHRDGGRYALTSAVTVTRDPDTGLHNVGVYRGMLSQRNTIPMLLSMSQGWGRHLAKYQERSEDMPVAVVIGEDPAIFMSAATPITHTTCSEYEYAGALKQRPVELVKCETSDLLVPAHAEIVLEGKISADPKTFEKEGPFSEYTGYMAGETAPRHTLRVECVTYRSDPVFVGCITSRSPGRRSETQSFTCATFSAIASMYLEQTVPGVTAVWSPVVRENLRVQIRKIHRGHAQQVANAVWGAKIGNLAAKHLFVVDEDIDIFDDEAMEWALAFRVNAAMGDIVFFPGTMGSPLDPSIPFGDRDRRKYGAGRWTRVLVDATINWEHEPRPEYGGNRYPPLATDVDPEQEKLVTKRWKEYGLEDES